MIVVALGVAIDVSTIIVGEITSCVAKRVHFGDASAAEVLLAATIETTGFGDVACIDRGELPEGDDAIVNRTNWFVLD